MIPNTQGDFWNEKEAQGEYQDEGSNLGSFVRKAYWIQLDLYIPPCCTVHSCPDLNNLRLQRATALLTGPET